MPSLNRLDQKIRLERRTSTTDILGGEGEPTWVLVAELWASVIPQSGTERMMARQIEAPAVYRVTIRNREVDTSWRVVWKGLAGNIRFNGNNSDREMYRTFDVEFGVAT